MVFKIYIYTCEINKKIKSMKQLENFTNSYIYIYRERDRETNMSNRKIYIGGYQNENDCYDNYNHYEKVDNEYQTDNNNRRRKQRIDLFIQL